MNTLAIFAITIINMITTAIAIPEGIFFDFIHEKNGSNTNAIIMASTNGIKIE